MAYVMKFNDYFPPEVRPGVHDKYAVVTLDVNAKGQKFWLFVDAEGTLDRAKKRVHLIAIDYARDLGKGTKKKKVAVKRKVTKRLTKRIKKVTRR
jgi:hypothetical protein